VDRYGHARAVVFANGAELPAKSVLIAAGTQPNTVLAREEGVSLELDGKYFLATDDTGAPVKPERHTAKPKRPEVLLHRYPDGRFMSFFRSAPVVLRQRRESDGQREAGLSRRFQ